jgi:hypothetical protein
MTCRHCELQRKKVSEMKRRYYIKNREQIKQKALKYYHQYVKPKAITA